MCNNTFDYSFHSNGNIFTIIPDLIEISLDVLNPIQPACMDPLRLKQTFDGLNGYPSFRGALAVTVAYL